MATLGPPGPGGTGGEGGGLVGEAGCDVGGSEVGRGVFFSILCCVVEAPRDVVTSTAAF